MSNGSVNSHLKTLEAKAFLRHEKRFEKAAFQRKFTRYFSSFEPEFARKPTPNFGVGANSKKPAKPTPKNGKSQLQYLETNQVIEPVRNDGDSAREEILLAFGHDRTGITATGGLVGGLEDMSEIDRWCEDLRLSHSR